MLNEKVIKTAMTHFNRNIDIEIYTLAELPEENIKNEADKIIDLLFSFSETLKSKIEIIREVTDLGKRSIY